MLQIDSSKLSLHRYLVWSSSVFFLILNLSGCNDPYKEKLPSVGSLTPSQLEAVAEKLPPADAKLLRQWEKRVIAGITFGGEPTAPTVRDAIRNQSEYESKRAAELAEEVQRREQEKRIADEAQKLKEIERQSLIALANKRASTDNAIKQYFKIEASNYEFRPIFDRSGYEIAREWLFRLKLTNLSQKTVIGASGYVTVKDVFGTELGSFGMRIEPNVPTGKSIMFDATMTHNRKNPQHLAMLDAKTMFVSWFMESVAFQDGTRIDQGMLDPLPLPASSNQKKFSSGSV